MTSSPERPYRDAVAAYLRDRATLPATARRELLAELCSSRGQLNFTGKCEALGPEDEQVRAQLTASDLQSTLEHFDLDELRAREQQFVQLSERHGGDIGLIEPEGAQEEAREIGQMLLWERHDIECQLEGMQWWVTGRADLQSILQPDMEKCRRALSALDETWQREISHFLRLNAYRRAYRDLDSTRREFWWWTLLADCDLDVVYRIVDSQSEPTAHVQTCTACQELLARLQQTRATLAQARGPRVRHPTATTIVRVFHGEGTASEDAWVEAHTRTCERCQRELAALQFADAEEAQDRARERVHSQPVGSGSPLSPAIRRPSVSPLQRVSSVQVRLQLPQEKLAAAGEPQSIPLGRHATKLYQDNDIEVWVRQDNSQVVFVVLGQKVEEIIQLEMTTPETATSQNIPRTSLVAGQGIFTLGEVKDLAGRGIQLSLRDRDRTLEFQLTFATEQ
jgi:hypothetical protein